MNFARERPVFLSERLPLNTALLCIAFLVIVVVAIDWAIRALEDRSPKSVRRRWITNVRFVRGLTCFAIAILAGYVLFNPIGILGMVLATGVYLRSIFARRRDETESVNTLIRMVADHGGAIPDALDSFAPSCRSIVRRRSHDFAFWLRCGTDAGKSAHRSGLALMPDTMVAIQSSGADAANSGADAANSGADAANSGADAAKSNWGRDDDLLGDASLESQLRWLRWPVSSQLLYLLTLVVVCALMVTLLHIFIFPTMEKMQAEFNFYRNEPRRAWFKTFFDYWPSIVTLIVIIGCCWLVLVAITAIAPNRFWTRITPWFGNWVRQRNRWIGVRALAGGLQRGESLPAILESASGATRSRWIRSRSRDALNRLQRGEGTAAALQRSGWVSQAESQWLHSAEVNNALPTAMNQLSTQIRRRYDLRWQLRLAWLVPLVTIIVAGVVFIQATAMFVVMTEMIYGLS